MKFNYNLELSNIIENIYKETIYKIAINSINIDFCIQLYLSLQMKMEYPVMISKTF